GQILPGVFCLPAFRFRIPDGGFQGADCRWPSGHRKSGIGNRPCREMTLVGMVLVEFHGPWFTLEVASAVSDRIPDRTNDLRRGRRSSPDGGHAVQPRALAGLGGSSGVRGWRPRE